MNCIIIGAGSETGRRSDDAGDDALPWYFEEAEIDPKLIRPVVLVVVIATALGAYIWHRRAKVRANEAAAPTVSEQEGDRDAKGGMGPGPEDGRGDEGDGNQGPREGGDHGAEQGSPDPEGQPGTMGPRGESICIRKAAPAAADAKRYQTAGKLVVGGTVKTGKTGVTAILAVNAPLEKWPTADKVLVYESIFTLKEAFQLDFRAAGPVFLCAIRTGDYQEFTTTHLGGCVPAADGELTITMAQLKTNYELIGLSPQIPQHAWPGTQQRNASGVVTMADKPGARFLIAAADFPILEQPDAEANPSALAITAADGRFDVGFLASAKVPLYICAMGLPPKNESIKTKTHLFGSACTKVQVPSEGRVVGVTDVKLALDASKKTELTTHEQEHFDFLSRCLSP